MTEVFQVVQRRWRGIGEIAESGLGLADAYRDFDAEARFGPVGTRAEESTASASPGWSCAARRSRRNARPSARAARPSIRSASPWSRPRAPAPPTTAIAASPPTRPSSADGRQDFALCLSRALARRRDHPGRPWRRRPRKSERLIDTIFRPAFDDPELARRHDGARLDLSGPVAFTTDTYVVRPLVFPGGDIGTLAVNGTVNDLAMCGARPDYLSAGFILEEGLADRDARAASSPRCAGRPRPPACARHRRHQGRRSRQGRRHLHQHRRHRPHRRTQRHRAASRCRPGDVVILSGDVARHGIAVMAARERPRLRIRRSPATAPRWPSRSWRCSTAGIEVHCLRDLTRGGLASGLVEIAETGGARHRRSTSARSRCASDVASACEILGLDPFHVANEGRFVAFVAAADADRALAVLRAHAVSDGRGRHRHGPRRPGRPGDGQGAPWRHARDRHAERRATAAHLLTGRGAGHRLPGSIAMTTADRRSGQRTRPLSEAKTIIERIAAGSDDAPAICAPERPTPRMAGCGRRCARRRRR